MLFGDGGGGLSEETLEQSTAGEGATLASGGRALQAEVHSGVCAKVRKEAHDGLVQTAEGPVRTERREGREKASSCRDGRPL